MGGQSRRLGRDKAWIEIGGVPLWRRTCSATRTALGRKPILVGDRLEPERHQGFGILRDARPGKGPLGGLVSALRHCKSEWALVLAVDLPFLEEKDILRLTQAKTPDLDVLTLSMDDKPEPLAALYRKATLEFWEGRLSRNELSLHEGIEQLRWSVVRLPRGSRALFDLNRPEDLEAI